MSRRASGIWEDVRRDLRGLSGSSRIVLGVLCLAVVLLGTRACRMRSGLDMRLERCAADLAALQARSTDQERINQELEGRFESLQGAAQRFFPDLDPDKAMERLAVMIAGANSSELPKTYAALSPTARDLLTRRLKEVLKDCQEEPPVVKVHAEDDPRNEMIVQELVWILGETGYRSESSKDVLRMPPGKLPPIAVLYGSRSRTVAKGILTSLQSVIDAQHALQLDRKVPPNEIDITISGTPRFHSKGRIQLR